MPFRQRFGFIHPDTHGGAYVPENTVAHELGHGVAALEHPDQNGDPDPDNLMHSNATNHRLRHGQWVTLNPPN